MKPFLKWAGGKSWLAPRIVDLARELPPFRYLEPFCGAGAVFFALKEAGLIRSEVQLNDANEELINVYRMLRDRPEDLFRQLEWCASQHSEPFYYQLREWYLAELEEVDRAARTMYLNKAGFNGLYRVNKAGKFNVPWGKKKSVKFDFENLKECSEALQGVKLTVGCGIELLRTARTMPDSAQLTYIDPPYLETFNSYTKSGFDLKMQEDLAMHAIGFSGRVIVSNSAAEERYWPGAKLIDVQHRMRHTKAQELLWDSLCTIPAKNG